MAIEPDTAKRPRIEAGSARKPALRCAPSLDALRAFEVAARLLSFTRAAAELCVTQGAVSQRIKALEHELRFDLFERRKTGLVLTSKGRCLADGIRTGLQQITRVVEQAADEIAGPLVVSVLPSFASRWLIPRLKRFAALGSDANVQILAENGLADLQHRDVHAALRFGPGNYPGLKGTLLMRDSIMPVCSPDLLARFGPVVAATDLAHLPVLHDSSTEDDGSGTDTDEDGELIAKARQKALAERQRAATVVGKKRGPGTGAH